MYKKDKGSALVLVMAISSVLLLAALAAGMSSVSDVELTTEEKIHTELEFACESAVNRARAKIEQAFNNSDIAQLEPFIHFDGLDVDETGLTPDQKAYSDEIYESCGAHYCYTYNIDSNNDGETDINVRYAVYQEPTFSDPNGNGWKKSQFYTSHPMRIEAIAVKPGYGWVGMMEKAVARRSTLFMYNIFFENDLEILPGQSMTQQGLIHTNENLYLVGSGLDIRSDSVTAAEEIFRKRLDTNETGGTVKISKEGQEGDLVTMGSSEDSSNSDWVDIAISKWKGVVRDKHLGATRMEAPELESFEPGGYYDKKAGLRIKYISANDTYEISINNGTPVTVSTDADKAEWGLNEMEFYDYRETPNQERKTKVTTLDVEKLGETGYYPDNGLIYFTRDDAIKDSNPDDYTADSNRRVTGLFLHNGKQIPAATTLVTDLPTYVHGDFNLHPEDPGANSDQAWYPCAIVSDAINVLSSNWEKDRINKLEDVNKGVLEPDDEDAPDLTFSNSKKPNASSTTFNMVMITGNTKTKPNVSKKDNNYNGGLENYPRMLENWSGDTLNIQGAFMQLFRSQYATGRWNYNNYYTAPSRNFLYEEKFTDIRNFPPMFTDLFPSLNFGIVYSDWEQIDKDLASI